MSIWGAFTVDIYNRDRVLQGTITTALPGGRGMTGLNEHGNGEFVMPASDTAGAALLEEYHIAVGKIDNSLASRDVIVFAFEILDIDPEDNPDGNIIRVKGLGITHELEYDNLGYALISNGSGGASNSWVADILAYTTETWTSHNVGTAGSKAHLQASGETIWESLVQLHEQNGKALTYVLFRAPDRQLSIINENLPGSTIFDYDELTLIETNDPSTYEGDFDYGVIRKFRKRKETAETVTRVYAYGAGLGGGVLTIEMADGLVTLPSGFTANFATSEIINSDLENEIGQPLIHKRVQFGHIKPETNDPNDPNFQTALETAAIQVVEGAVEHLKERKGDTRVFYEVEAILHGDYVPGQLVRLIHNGRGIDDDFVLLELKHEVDPKGFRLSKIVLGETTRRRQPDGDTVTVKKIQKIDEVLRHATAPNTAGAPGGGQIVNDAQFILVTDHPGVINRRIAADGLGTVFNDGGAGGAAKWDVNLSNQLAAILDANAGELDLDSQSANLIFAGPGSGGAAKPGFRSLVDSDIPASIARDGELHDAVTLASDADTLLSLSGQTLSLDSQGANLVLAGPTSGAADDPAFRALIFADIPTDNDPTGEAVLATDVNGRFGAEGFGLGTAPDGDYFKVADNGIIGLGNGAEGHIQFDNQATDEINFLNCYVGIGKSAPDRPLDVAGSGGIARFGDGSGYTSVLINGAAGNGRDLIFQSGGSNRWILRTNSDSEGGGDAGSNFRILSRADDGSALDEVLSLNRETGQAEFANRLSLNGGAWSDAWQNYGLSVYLDSSTTFGAIFGDPAVAHGMTTYAPTQAFLALRNRSTTQGGAVVSGYSENEIALVIEAFATGEDTSEDTGSTGAIILDVAKKNGTGITSLSSDANAVVIQSNGSAKHIFKTNGDYHRAGSLFIFDRYNDVQLARLFNEIMNPTEAGTWIHKDPTYTRQTLYESGILVNQDPADGNMYNESALTRLAIGMGPQLYSEMMELKNRIVNIEATLNLN